MSEPLRDQIAATLRRASMEYGWGDEADEHPEAVTDEDYAQADALIRAGLVVPQPPNPPDAEDAFMDWWETRPPSEYDPHPKRDAFFAGWEARGERVTPEPALTAAEIDDLCHWYSYLPKSLQTARDQPLWDKLCDLRAGSPVPADPEEPA